MRTQQPRSLAAGLVYLLAAAVIWGFTPVFTGLHDGVPMQLIFLRTQFSALLFGAGLASLVWWAGDITHAGKTGPKPENSFSIRHFLIAGAGAAASNCFFAGACLVTAPENVYAVFYSFPFLSMGLDYFLDNRKPSRLQLYAVMLAIAGTIVFGFATWRKNDHYWGELLALSCALAWIACTRSNQHLPTVKIRMGALFTGQVLAMIVLAPFVLPGMFTSETSPTGWQFGLGAIFGICSAIPVWCWTQGVRHIRVHLAGIIVQSEGVFAIVLVLLILGRVPSMTVMIGSTIILIASALAIGSEKKEE